MKSIKFLKKIKSYALASFLVPLIAVNSCLVMYKILGDISLFPNFEWNKEEVKITLSDYDLINDNDEAFTFTNCPKYLHDKYAIFGDNQIININLLEKKDLLENSVANNKVKFITIKYRKTLDDFCVENHPFLYSILKKSSSLEAILKHAKQNNPTGFVQIKNPYFYGEVSVSRTARYFPAVLIFKPLIILSAFLLFLFWKNNLYLFRNSENISVKFSKKFFYFGVFSCIFLILHATFLGVDFNSKLFDIARKLIIILFIFSEICAQILLTKNLFIFREELKKYINPLILKTKIIFVTMVFFITCVAFMILAFGDPSTAFKHILEWNYFSFLLLFYLLSALYWKKDKT